jgi:hypothetical protein
MNCCAVDGVAIGESRSGRLVHLGELPKGVDPDHDIVAIAASEYADEVAVNSDLKSAVEDLILHHATLHPLTECVWTDRVHSALRSRR